MEGEKKKFYQKWWFWTIIVIVIIGACGSNFSENTTQNTSQNNSQNILQDNTVIDTSKNITFLEKSNGKEFFENMCEVAELKKTKGEETENFIIYKSKNSNYSVEIKTNKNNEVNNIKLMAFNKDYENFFIAISRFEYTNSDRAEAFNWIHNNLGKNAKIEAEKTVETKIGEATFKLTFNTSKKPILEVYPNNN